MKRFTKITASIGPNSEEREVLTRMISAGVNMCRLNFSHDTGDTQGQKIDMIRNLIFLNCLLFVSILITLLCIITGKYAYAPNSTNLLITSSCLSLFTKP